MYLNHIYYRRQEGFNCEKDERCFELLSESIKSVKQYLRINKPISPFIKRQSTEITVAGLVLVELTTNGFSGSNNSLVQNHWEMSNTIAHKPAIERILTLPSGGDDGLNQAEFELPKLDGEKKFNEKLRKANPEHQINGALRQTAPWYKKFLRKIDFTTLARVIKTYREPFDTHVKLDDQNQFTGLAIDLGKFKQGESLPTTNGNHPHLGKPRRNLRSPVNHQLSENGFKSKLSLKGDFESRNENQKILNGIKSGNNSKSEGSFTKATKKSSSVACMSFKAKEEDDKLTCPIEQPSRIAVTSSQPRGSSSSSFSVDAWTMPTIPSSRPTLNRNSQPQVKPLFSVSSGSIPGSQSSPAAPTPQRFSANQNGDIQDINRAFNHFRNRMTEIGNQYNGTKRKYFFEQLNACTIDRFENLSTVSGRLTISGVREAETALQSEFEGLHESKSITRPTNREVQAGNYLDGRFRKGILSGEFNTLNERFTDVDFKVLVSDLTLQLQANSRKLLGGKNPTKFSLKQQGYNSGLSVVEQKHKHCNSAKSELPSSAKNVKHIINLLELVPNEKQIVKESFTDGARFGWAEKLNVPEHSISDETALEGIIFLNEDITIKRID